MSIKKDRTRDLILEQLKNIPIISVACEKVGVSRASVNRWRKDDVEFLRQSEDAIREGIGHINDLSENQLLSLVGKERMPAIQFWLRNNHERYGAKARINPVPTVMETLDPDDPKLKKIQEITQRYEDDLRNELIKEIYDKHQ